MTKKPVVYKVPKFRASCISEHVKIGFRGNSKFNEH